jgi:hypothetical protein
MQMLERNLRTRREAGVTDVIGSLLGITVQTFEALQFGQH